jgi:tRNA(Arg) A34 adenosine deaminase TadA
LYFPNDGSAFPLILLNFSSGSKFKIYQRSNINAQVMKTNKNTKAGLTGKLPVDGKDVEFMREAIQLSVENVKKGGGPFGAIVVKDGKIIGKGVNRVVANNDATAHAEVLAIRNACKNLNSFDLSGSVIYTSCEPCPMCLGAIYWAQISRICFGNNRNDAENIGFSDKMIYEELMRAPENRSVRTEVLMQAEASEAFRMWMEMEDKIRY